MHLEFAILSKDIRTDDFDCEIESLNEFISKYALINQSRKLSITIVSHTKEDLSKRIIGYYSLCPAQIEPAELPTKISRSLPKYPIPAIRLCRLAIDKKFQKKGCGKELLVHALFKCYQQSIELGGYCVIVDAINDQAKAFYEKFGFQAYINHPNSLFMPMKSIEAYILNS